MNASHGVYQICMSCESNLSAKVRSSVRVSFMSQACLDYVISLVCSLHGTIHLCARWHREQPNHSCFQSFHVLSSNNHLSLGFSLIPALWQDPLIVLPTSGCFFEQREILLQMFCMHRDDQSQDCSWIASTIGQTCIWWNVSFMVAWFIFNWRWIIWFILQSWTGHFQGFGDYDCVDSGIHKEVCSHCPCIAFSVKTCSTAFGA